MELGDFREIWFCDFEFYAPTGERPLVRCMVARELLSKRVIKLWADELGSEPPFNTGKDALFVAFFASAELGCFRSLGWNSPYWVLDFYPEIRNLTNGKIPVVIQSDAASPVQSLVTAMDVVGQLGLPQVSIATTRPIE